MGAPQSALLALTGLPIDSSTRPAPTVDPSGYNLKKLQGAKQDGTRQNHDSFLDTLSRWLARAKIPHMGGKCGNPRTCKGLFLRISYRLAQIEEAAGTSDEAKALKILQQIIPDLAINGCSLSGNGFLAGRKSVADLKTLSTCGPQAVEEEPCPSAVGSMSPGAVDLVEEEAFDRFRRLISVEAAVFNSFLRGIQGPLESWVNFFMKAGVRIYLPYAN